MTAPVPDALGLDRLRQRTINFALGTAEFRDVLREAAVEIRGQSTPEATEATVEGVIERVVYSRLRDIGFAGFHPSKEVGVDLLRDVQRGRMDSRIDTLVIEYKKPALMRTQLQLDAAVGQLEGYLTSLGRDEDAELVGFLTNGLKVVEVRSRGDAVTSRSAVRDLDGDALLRLVRAIVSTAQTALTAPNLIRDFCGTADGALFDVARTLRESLIGAWTPKTQMLFGEWEQLFSLAHDDISQQRRIEERRRALGAIYDVAVANPEDEYKALFALHTAYAVVLKLIAFRVVSDAYGHRIERQFNALAGAESDALRVACESLEDGEVFRSLGIGNLLEGDFFSWYADDAQWTDEIAAAIRACAVVLARYEETAAIFSAAGVPDLFRDLYEATVPREVRSSFGEFYTPRWLADHVLDAAISTDEWRVLDPCCGSGTFLIGAIARVRAELGTLPAREQLDAVLARVVGIDLNPLAVLTTRIHYFIHVSDLIAEVDPDSITIPVFLGDTATVPERVELGGVECLRYELKTLRQPVTAVLPVSLVSDIPAFFALVREYEADIRAQDDASAVARLVAAVADEERVPEVLSAIDELSKDLIRLEAAGWNGIWGRILANFLATACLGRFSAVVGNPPWIDWKNLPAGYRDRLKGSETVRGIFSGAGRTGGINLNVCALISYVAMTSYLAEAGTLAFLMPRELINQPSYEGWRKLGGHGRIREVHDWSDAGHPFDPVREDFMTYLIDGGRPTSRIPVSRYRKKAGSTAAAGWQSLADALANLEMRRAVAGRVVPGSTGFTFADSRAELREMGLVAGECAYYGREGIEFYPQELLLFEFDGVGPRDGTVWLKNVQVQRSKHRIPRRRVLLETRYLLPLVKGPGIKPFEYVDQGLIVAFPYDASDPHRPVGARDLRTASNRLYEYFRLNKTVFESQTEFSDRIRGEDRGEYYGLARTGPYSFARTHVAFRDNSKWCAAVVSDHEMPWGERRRYAFQNHAVSVCERSDRTFIGETEAHYICAILNAPTVAKFILASSDERSFKIRPPVYVPLYDGRNALHRELARLSRLAHRRPEERSRALAHIDTTYLELCRRAGRGARATV